MISNYAPRDPATITVADSVKDAVPGFGAGFDALSLPVKFLAALNARTDRHGRPIPMFAGIDPAEKARRRAAGRVAKASRKANR